MTPEERRETMQQACDLIATGELVTQAAKAVGLNPATLWKWAESDPLLGKMYAHAKESAADALADEALEVARASTNETAQADRLRVDTLKWAAAKRRPKEYGDKQSIEVSGGIEHLHLDALRKVSATARISNTVNTLAITEGDTVQDVDTEA